MLAVAVVGLISMTMWLAVLREGSSVEKRCGPWEGVPMVSRRCVRYHSSVEGGEKALGPGTQGAGRLGGDIGAARQFFQDCRRFVMAAESGETIG